MVMELTLWSSPKPEKGGNWWVHMPASSPPQVGQPQGVFYTTCQPGSDLRGNTFTHLLWLPFLPCLTSSLISVRN